MGASLSTAATDVKSRRPGCAPRSKSGSCWDTSGRRVMDVSWTAAVAGGRGAALESKRTATSAPEQSEGRWGGVRRVRGPLAEFRRASPSFAESRRDSPRFTDVDVEREDVARVVSHRARHEVGRVVEVEHALEPPRQVLLERARERPPAPLLMS